MHNSYSPPLAESRRLPAERILWGKGVASAPPMVNYEEVMQSEEGVLKWLTKIVRLTRASSERQRLC